MPKEDIMKRCKDCKFEDLKKFPLINDELFVCFSGSLPETADNCRMYHRKRWLWVFPRFWRPK